MTYTLSDIATVISGKLSGKKSGTITDIVTDSRSTFFPDKILFFAIVGERHNGHAYIAELYERGVRAFVVSEEVDVKKYADVTFIKVENTLQALQALATHHRRQLTYPVVSVTGSNGKTIVKEWISQLLSSQLRIVRSPKSYNSQVGVPLSVWRMSEEFELGIFEAGISLPGEMEKLENIIRPDVVVVTNIGEAHQEGFATRDQKLREKLRLCNNAEGIVYCADQYEVHTAIRSMGQLAQKQICSWGVSAENDIQVALLEKGATETRVIMHDLLSQKKHNLTIPFSDAASVENALQSFTTCVALARMYPSLNINLDNVASNVAHLSPIAMRLDLHEGVNGCTIINDTYNADVASLRIALDFLTSFAKHRRRTVILSDIQQSGKEGWRLYQEVGDQLREHGVSRLIAIGSQITKHTDRFSCETICFTSVEQFLRQFDRNILKDEAILIKGSRNFSLERISHQLIQKTHLTTLEVNLTALTDNLNSLRARLKKEVKTLVLVKAFAYGAGISEVARLLQHQRVNYLGVAFADEGVQLREAGIGMPILVLNPEPGTFEQMLEYRLEPEIYSLSMLQRYSEAVMRSGEGVSNIHLKLDTGMHRLGFVESEIDELLQCLSRFRNLKVASIFSHLAAADETQHDEFTLKQIALFDKMSKKIESDLGYKTLRHLANSAGVERFPQAQFDMVRLGISFYGSSATKAGSMRTVSTLKSTIVQIKDVPAGDTVGYGRKGQVAKDKRIAVIPVGYADGLNRLLSNGVGEMLVNGKLAPIIGNICMDTCMVDITNVGAQEGDEVIIFGENPNIASMATKLKTIPYEVFTRISPRVKRVYFSE